ncbi:hypothetical protein BDY19DRAFT_964985 [Irpex rosettiformis]|uniref:Uncharacterized protein n=1 Tax=Irpex rosettiformis TaxID=378272 RepID=A0ACB8TUC0_9APHY|nr:hypothetical protein BDY19DRAFT_964985 [Irpex rosettiformis]
MSNVVQEHATILPLLSRALHQIRSTPPRVIASPATQPRRAAVALIIRIAPPPTYPLQPSTSTQPVTTDLTEFFKLDWVNSPGARPEILFLQRENPQESSNGGRMNETGQGIREAHVAFPGGRTESDDENGMYTAMRQTWEEIGLDLAEPAYLPIGQLDDREITTSLGKRLLMILSPFIFLQVTPHTTPVDPAAGTTLHWVPLTELVPDILTTRTSNGKGKTKAGKQHSELREPRPRWSSVTVDASSRLASRHSPILRLLIKVLVGNMTFPAILIDPAVTTTIPSLLADEKSIDAKRARIENGHPSSHLPKKRRGNEELKLWGLSLGMTLDLLAQMTPAANSNATGALVPPETASDTIAIPVLAPSLTSVLPRFSYPDVNFWIWVFGKRYREVVRGWEASVRAGGVNDRRINWTGSALSTFYAAVRKALVVVIVVRAIWILLGIVFGAWLLFW